MSINSEIKQKQKEANLRYERQWQRQQTMNVIRGLLLVAIFVGGVVMLSWLWG